MGVPTPVGVYTPARPAPPARRRSTSVPWGTSSYSRWPAAALSAAADSMFGRETNDTISRETWLFSISFAAAPPTPLATRHRSRAPCSTAAASRLFGTPELRPKPETAIEAPSGRSATASAGEATTLSIRAPMVDGAAAPRISSIRPNCDVAMTLFGLRVTLLRFRVTLPVTLRDYAEQKRMGGRAAAGVKAVVQAMAVLVRAIVGGGGDYPASPRGPRRAASQR